MCPGHDTLTPAASSRRGFLFKLGLGLNAIAAVLVGYLTAQNFTGQTAQFQDIFCIQITTERVNLFGIERAFFDSLADNGIGRILGIALYHHGCHLQFLQRQYKSKGYRLPCLQCYCFFFLGDIFIFEIFFGTILRS